MGRRPKCPALLDRPDASFSLRNVRSSPTHLLARPSETRRRIKGREDMKPTRKISRRSFLGRVAGGAIAGGAALTVLGESASALQVTDSDTGQNSDPPGRGRTGVTDSDTGGNSD